MPCNTVILLTGILFSFLMNALLFCPYICALLTKDDINLAINAETSGEQSKFQFEAATKFDSAL